MHKFFIHIQILTCKICLNALYDHTLYKDRLIVQQNDTLKFKEDHYSYKVIFSSKKSLDLYIL
jgi:hypothetical protein